MAYDDTDDRAVIGNMLATLYRLRDAFREHLTVGASFDKGGMQAALIMIDTSIRKAEGTDGYSRL